MHFKAIARSLRLTIALVPLALAVPESAFGQDHYISACVTGTGMPPLQCDQGATASMFQQSVEDSGPWHRFAYASAVGRPGRLGAESYTDTWGLNNSALGRATSFDTLTITSTDPAVVPGVTRGTFDLRIPYSGGLQASVLQLPGGTGGIASARVDITLFVTNGAGINIQRSVSCHFDAEAGYQGDPTGVLAVTLTFVYGQPFTVNLALSVVSRAFGLKNPNNGAVSRSLYRNDGFVPPGRGDAEGPAQHSAYWGGIEQVFLESSGDPVAQFSVTSASGTDYRIDFSRDPLFGDGFEP